MATPFNHVALHADRYILIGRRGAGKTSLSRFFEFQSNLPGSTAITAGPPRDYFGPLARLAESLGSDEEYAIGAMSRVWTYLVWQLIFTEYRLKASNISLARALPLVHSPPDALRELVDDLTKKSDPIAAAARAVSSEAFINVAADVRGLTKSNPVFISLDVREKYDPRNDGQMRALAALVQAASHFEQNWSRHGIYIKVFIPAEIYPTLCESYILNPAKFVRKPVYMHWSPKDLVRLVCWRLWKTLTEQGVHVETPDWDKPKSVYERCWAPFFGESIQNGCGVRERTLAYVLRHTQLQPRQVVRLCNEIANTSSTFPRFSQSDIVASIAALERELARDVLNSYSKSQSHINEVIDVLSGLPMVFEGSELDKIARKAAHALEGGYNLHAFRRLVAEIGIVGRVRKDSNGIIEADFEYFTEDRLGLSEHDTCAVHPMFFERLNIDTSQKYIVLPFPDRQLRAMESDYPESVV